MVNSIKIKTILKGVKAVPITMSPMRYPGGKSQLYNFIRHNILINNIKDVVYCEPFAGGSGVALSLLLNNDVQSIVLNDLDISIYSLWYGLLYETERFVESIYNIPVTIDEWRNQKSIYR